MFSQVVRSGVVSLVVFIAAVAAAALFGGEFTPTRWYTNLAKPDWHPPNVVFSIVWAVLYLAVAIAGWQVWRRTERMTRALNLWIAQLVLNTVWSFMFFGLHRPDIAVFDSVILFVTIIAFIFVSRRHSKLASWLFVPYAVWVAFATALNVAIIKLN